MKENNSKMKYLSVNRIGLFSKSKSIEKGEEITYSYCDGYKNMPWRKNRKLSFLFTKPDGVAGIEDSFKFCKYCMGNNTENK